MVHSLLNCPMLNLFAILASCHPRLSCDWMCQLKTKVPQHCSSMHSPHLNASIWWLFLKLRFHQKLPNNGLLSNIPVQSWKMLFKTTMLRQQAMISHHENKQSLSGQKSNTFGQWVGWRVSGDEWRSILRHWIGLSCLCCQKLKFHRKSDWTQFFLVKTRIHFWIKEQRSRVFKNS